jgi:hypothetical protein
VPGEPRSTRTRHSAFHFESAHYLALFRRFQKHLPDFEGSPILIRSFPGLRDRHGAVHAGSFLRARRILFDCAAAEFPRIFVHEVFHFVWLRAGNPRRSDYEQLLRDEARVGARGELGWSSEWRKRKLTATDRNSGTRRWREYACESFCDTAAWLYSGTGEHEEFTLSNRFRSRRVKWFQDAFGNGPLSI